MVLKLYAVFSRESVEAMKGIRGKMAAQAGHAFMHAFWDAEVRFPDDAKMYRSTENGHEQPQKAYKICLIADTNADLEALYQYQKDRGGATRVVDSALTVLDNPMLTCVGFGPLEENQKSEKLKSLKTFN